jgi:glycosyltransferase involved in cell wall biosynthesis
MALAYSAFGMAYRVVQVAEATRRNWLPVATCANFQVIRNGIRPELIDAMVHQRERTAARADLGIGPDECCLLLVGSVSTRKGQADVIAAVEAMRDDTVARIRVLIVGDLVERTYGERLQSMLRNLPEHKRARISVVGSVADPSTYYAAADIFVCCSQQESAPRALVEAMAFGLPIVATAVDGIPELVRFGTNAICFRPADILALADILDQLASSPIDRLRLGRASKIQIAAVNDHETMVLRFGRILGEAALLRHMDALQSD